MCSDIWIGPETHRIAAEQQRQKHAAFIKEHGVPGWIESVEGNEITVTFFSGDRKNFPAVLGPDPRGKMVFVRLADEFLKKQGPPPEQMTFADHLPEADTTGTYGCSGVRWKLASTKLPGGYLPGTIVRVFESGWPAATLSQN